MIRVSIVDPAELDFDQHADLLKRSFQHLLAGTSEEDTLSAEFFRWKYGGPLMPARIALVHENGRLVAANARFALNVIWNGQRTLAWQSSDGATDPAARGKGYFMKCVEALDEDLGPDTISFGFPNKSSIKTFVNLGWTEQQVLTAWVRPMPGWISRGADAMERIVRFDDDDVDALFAGDAVGRPPMIERTAAYLNWRYVEHPAARYEVFGLRRGSQLRGITVLRKARLAGRAIALIMELESRDARTEATLLKFSSSWGRAQRAWPVVTFSTALSYVGALRSAFCPVPARFLPKRQVLMGKGTGEYSERVFREKWSLNLGDWDGL